MINTIDNSCDEKKIKLYVSCFSYCPIIGKLNNDMIVNEVVNYYHKYNTIHDICLTDTCGSLQFNDFKYIIDRLDKNNVEFNRFSLHLQKQYNHQNIKNIICYAMKTGISSFNVSNISSIDLPNMSTYEMVGNIEYDNIYECLLEHLLLFWTYTRALFLYFFTSGHALFVFFVSSSNVFGVFFRNT